MSLYPAPDAGYGGISGGLFPFKVVKDCFHQWIQLAPIMSLSGREYTSCIVKRQLGDREGLQYRVGKLNALNFKNPAVNFDQRRGTAQQQKIDEDRVDIDFKSFVVQIQSDQILRQGSPFDLPAEASSQLVEAFSRLLNFDLFNAMTITNYPALVSGSALAGNVAGNFPSYDRVVFPIANGTLVPRATYQANASFPTRIDAMQTSALTTPAGSGLSAKHLETLKQYAERGNAPDLGRYTEDGIRPALVKSKAGWPMNKYVYLAHPQTLTSLFADPLFAQSTFFRGTSIDQENTPQTINGADYVGEWRGIAIYSCGELGDYAIASQDGTKQAAWNIFMGAGAVSLGWGQNPEIGMDNDLIEHSKLYFGHEWRGQKMLRFASKYAAGAAGAPVAGSNKFVEQGLIHSFVSI